jgi:hypothetical protein
MIFLMVMKPQKNKIHKDYPPTFVIIPLIGLYLFLFIEFIQCSNLFILFSDKLSNPFPKLLYNITNAIEKLIKSLCF